MEMQARNGFVQNFDSILNKMRKTIFIFFLLQKEQFVLTGIGLISFSAITYKVQKFHN